MITQLQSTFYASWLLIRSIAVVSSSIATIISTMLPLVIFYPFSAEDLLPLFLLLIVGAFLIHGVLTHILNDYIDYQSGTDENSPAILSGGSRVIQTGHISFETMRKMGKWLVITLIIASFLLAVFGFPRISILLLIGVWGAASYSLSPLQFSYRPFAGDWFSLFPALFFLGIAGAWLALGHIPEWALQNATINALFCMAWVMVHHIPDIKADQQASPKKQTSVVWSAEKLGIARFPALLYLSLIGLSTLWLGMDRMWAAIGVLFIVGVAIFLVAKMKTEDHEQVSAIEKMLLLLAVVTAIWLGIFI